MSDTAVIRSSNRIKNKRLLTPEKKSPNQVEQITKKKKKSSPFTKEDMEEIMKLITDQISGVSKQLIDTQTAIDNKITSMDVGLKDELGALKTAMDNFSSNVKNQISELKTELINHNNRITNNENDIDRVTLLNQLRLTGLPAKENENLKNIFDKIAAEIGYNTDEPNSQPVLKRIPYRKNGILSGSNTIIMYFVAQHFKDKFYSLYLQKAPLKPDIFSNDENSRIIIGENLTKFNAAILQHCFALKRDVKLAQAYSFNGIVYIKFKKGKNEPAFPIRNKIDVDVLIEKRTAESNQNMNQQMET